MTGEKAPSYPRTLTCACGQVELRRMGKGDEAAVLDFARALPEHDLLFLPRDITHPKVLAAWMGEIERGALVSLLAWRDGSVVGCAAIVRDPLSWSPHVGELRIVLSPELRGQGLGRLLTQDCFALALSLGIEKMVAQMTVDQKGAIAVFEGMGFRPEALLRDHVKNRAGVKYDLVILSHDVATFGERLAAYGVPEALGA